MQSLNSGVEGAYMDVGGRATQEQFAGDSKGENDFSPLGVVATATI